VNSVEIKLKLLISGALILVLMLVGANVLAQETQTPSEKIGTGALKVIEGELADSGVQSDSEMVSRAEELIGNGVPPGIVVSVVKSLKTGHLNPDELESALKDLEENVVKGGMPPGLVIKSIKTAYEIPEGAGDNGPERAGPPEGKGKPEHAGPPEGKGQNKEDGNKEDEGPPEDKGDPGQSGPPDEKGNGEGKGNSNNNDKSDNGKGKGQGPPDEKGNNGKGGPPGDEEG